MVAGVSSSPCCCCTGSAASAAGSTPGSAAGTIGCSAASSETALSDPALIERARGLIAIAIPMPPRPPIALTRAMRSAKLPLDTESSAKDALCGGGGDSAANDDDCGDGDCRGGREGDSASAGELATCVEVCASPPLNDDPRRFFNLSTSTSQRTSESSS